MTPPDTAPVVALDVTKYILEKDSEKYTPKYIMTDMVP